MKNVFKFLLVIALFDTKNQIFSSETNNEKDMQTTNIPVSVEDERSDSYAEKLYINGLIDAHNTQE